MAGLYPIIESWPNAVAAHRTRGQLLPVYMVVMITGIGPGQLLLNRPDPSGFELFMLISMLIALALVPMILSARRAPGFSLHEPISMRALHRGSPRGIAGGFSTGFAQGNVFGVGAAFASLTGLQPGQRVAACAGMVTVSGLGAALGPMICAAGMGLFGTESLLLLLFLFANHPAITAFGI